MKYFLKKVIVWTLYLALTILFFSLPVILRNHDQADFLSDSRYNYTQDGRLYFEFADLPAERRIEGDSTSLRMVAVTDTSRKAVYLFVNGEKQGASFVSDSMRIEFPHVYLKNGENEIVAVLSSEAGDTLALRKLRIVSVKKL